MKTGKPKCSDNFEIEDSDQGRHHTQLHNRIFQLEKEIAEIKKQLEAAKKKSDE